MFGCYRKGDANDPETYVAAITATLARYPQEVIRDVTHPATGLPIEKDFLPTVAEVYRACEKSAAPTRRREEREIHAKRDREQTEAREASKLSPEDEAIVAKKMRALADEMKKW